MATALAIQAFDIPNPCGQRNPAASGFLAGLAIETRDAITRASSTASFEAGSFLFCEDEKPAGVYIIRSGRVKLSLNSADGKAFIVRIALPGEIIGVSSAALAKPHQATAEAMQFTQVTFLPRPGMLRLMHECGDLSLALARELSLEFGSLCHEVTTLGLRKSAMSRLAQLMVGWVEAAQPQQNRAQLRCPMTHEQISQMIGTSRETVTRLLQVLHEKKVATMKKNILTVTNVAALRELNN